MGVAIAGVKCPAMERPTHHHGVGDNDGPARNGWWAFLKSDDYSESSSEASPVSFGSSL